MYIQEPGAKTRYELHIEAEAMKAIFAGLKNYDWKSYEPIGLHELKEFCLRGGRCWSLTTNEIKRILEPYGVQFGITFPIGEAIKDVMSLSALKDALDVFHIMENSPDLRDLEGLGI